jgi:hypothetical protein
MVLGGLIAGRGGVLQDVAMTDEGLPPAHQDAREMPELRASHEDREKVAEVLRVAAGDGRLTAAELDERLEAALTARTSGELSVLTADLPEPIGVTARAKELVRLDFQGGNATRRGQWIVPRRMEIRAVGGAVKLDFTEAVITGPTLDIQAEVRGGRLLLVTRPDIEVDADDVAARGGRVRVRPERGPEEPVRLKIKLSGEAHGGNVVVRPQRRTFWSWTRRKHRP